MSSNNNSQSQQPSDFNDPVIAFFKKDIDRAVLRENLKLTPAERIDKFQRAMQAEFELSREARDR